MIKNVRGLPALGREFPMSTPHALAHIRAGNAVAADQSEHLAALAEIDRLIEKMKTVRTVDAPKRRKNKMRGKSA